MDRLKEIKEWNERLGLKGDGVEENIDWLIAEVERRTGENADIESAARYLADNVYMKEIKSLESSKYAIEVSLGNQIDSLRDELAGMRAAIEANDATIESLRNQLSGK